MLHDHNRFKVVTEFQHWYEHSLEEFVYVHPALPTDTVQNVKDALDYILNVLYPRIQPAVLDVTQLPTVGNQSGDQRVVQTGRQAILSAGLNSDLVNGVLEVVGATQLTLGSIVHLGNVSVDKTSGYPDGQLYVGAVSVAPDTVTLYEDVALTTLADLSGLGLVDGISATEHITNNAVDTINGDNSEIWIWAQFDGQPAEQWNKIADLDWGLNSVIQALQDQTQYLYVMKNGTTDYDQFGVPLAGIDAGQHIYGGDQDNQNLTLHANNGDADGLPAGPLNTGYIQFDDNIRPTRDWDEQNPDTTNNGISVGTASERFHTGYFAFLNIGTASLNMTADANGSYIYESSASPNNIIYLGNPNDTNLDPLQDNITNIYTAGDARGNTLTANTSATFGGGTAGTTDGRITVEANQISTNNNSQISFVSAPLLTTGTLGAGTTTITDGVNSLEIDANSGGDILITALDSTLPGPNPTPTINFGSAPITTSGLITAGSADFDLLTVDDIQLDANGISIITTDTNLTVAANGTGVVDINSNMQTLNQDVVGYVDASNYVEGGNLRLSGDTLSNSVNAEILFGTHLKPSVANLDIGEDAAEHRLRNIYIQASTTTGIRTGDTDTTGSARELLATNTLMAFRNSNIRRADASLPTNNITDSAPQNDDILKWNASEGWIASNPDSEIEHQLLTNLDNNTGTDGDSGHGQFVVLDGRATAQTIYGSSATADNTQVLTLLDNQTGTSAGLIIARDQFSPNVDGYDIGGNGGAGQRKRFQDLYMLGEGYGFRAENYDSTPLPGANESPPTGNGAGQLAFDIYTDYLMVYDGGAWKKIGHNTYESAPLAHTNAAGALFDPAGHDMPAGVDASKMIVQVWQILTTGNVLVSVDIRTTYPEQTGVGDPSRIYITRDLDIATADANEQVNFKIIGIQV